MIKIFKKLYKSITYGNAIVIGGFSVTKLVLMIAKLIDECYEANPLNYIVGTNRPPITINDGLLFSDAVVRFLECDDPEFQDYIVKLKALRDLRDQEERIMDDIPAQLWHVYIDTQMNRYSN